MTGAGPAFEFDAELWIWQAGESAWHFVTLPVEVADEIDEFARSLGGVRGFGSVRVEAAIGATTWRTSVFPSKAHGSAILPVKRSVREAEDLADGSVARVRLHPLAD